MQVQVARISPVVMELAVEVPATEVTAEVEKAYVNLQRKARVRGFRPGKAPRQVLARLYGPQVASDVINAIVNDTLPKAITEQKVQPVNQPQVEAGKFEQGAAFSYKARFEVQPEVGDVSYEGLQLVRPPMTADEKMVEEQLEMLRTQHARLEAPEPARAAQKGDVVTIDFTLSVEGVDKKDAASEGVQIELGSGQLLPELEAAVAGKTIDDSFEVQAKLHESNPREDLRGKTATFHVKVKDIKQKVLPTLDDEFAKDVGSFQTLVELRADVHTRLERVLKDRADTVMAQQIVDQLNEKNHLDVPPTLVEQQCKLMEMEIRQNAMRMGQRPTAEDFQKIHDRIHADAEKKVRAGLLMAAIAKKNGIVVKDDDVQKGLQELAEQTGKNVAKVRAEYNDPQRRQILLGMILEDKVLDVIEAKAQIREGTLEEAQAAGQAPGKGAEARGAEARGAEATAETKTESQEGASKAKKKSKAKPEGQSEEK
jgi:trigger factor